MQAKCVARTGDQRSFVIVLDAGEEVFATLVDFAAEHRILAASLTALGAFERATVGWFDFSTKHYRTIPIHEQCEVLSLIGDIAEGDDGKPSLHAHAVLGMDDGSVRGGHLLEGHVRPTLEIMLVESLAHLRRRKRGDLGIALIDLEAVPEAE